MLMRTFRPSTALLLSLLFCAQIPSQTPLSSQVQDNTVRPDPKRAQKAVERGDKDLATGRFEEALAAYEEAARYAPQDASVVERAAALRSKLVRGYVEAAEGDALAGHLTEATEELGAALRIDPGNTFVRERLGQLAAMEDSQHPKPAFMNRIPGLPRLEPEAGKRNLNLRGDTKAAYEQLAGLFGVKVTFDPDVVARNVQLRIDGVDFYIGISLLGTQTGTFWRPVNAAMIFVAHWGDAHQS
jgi:general secretion pathway protein D